MWIDIIWLVLMVSAAFKGFRNGLIIGAFSFAAFFIGLAAALKLSALVAGYLQETFQKPFAWWPVIAFVAVFLVVGVLVRMAAGILEKTVNLAMLGWVNKLGGFLFYALLNTLIFSVALFYMDQVLHVSEAAKQQSRVYAYIQPWGEWTMNMLGNVIPWFKDVFNDMEEFFGKVGSNLNKS